ncbi:MAG TPA: glycoside hydrolase [Thermoanaerobaculia bacterium]|nr:glycoside hydrolase [Thermoanaerobaculia bacterium]
MKQRFTIALAFVAAIASAQVDPRMFQEMRWRMIGPFRGSRTVAAVGIASQPRVFYVGVNNGGVWKTNDYGRVWTPIFDDQPTGSIGAIALAPSDPNVIYVGSGEGLQRPDLSTGDGIYKSTDAGKTWTHLGLRDGQQIPMIAVDPRDPNRLFVAVLGHPYGPNAERGIFRSTDGGRTFEKVLYRDENTGGIDVVIDPSNSQNVYAALWEARQAPWENGEFSGLGSGLFKSTDGGTTWHQVTSGLPSNADIGRAGIEVAPANPNRLYAICGVKQGAGGVYRSDDAGESWSKVNGDERLWGRPGDFNEVRTDPKNADIVYVANIVTWKSADGGHSFKSFRGAPGGDDYHRIWINPNDTNTILIASDQGAIVTVNGGETWSSWYNQPSAQMFHVSTDNAFPYRVCGGQQESGSACVQSRGDDGAITFREWHPVAAEEYGYAVPDPLNPDLIYGGKISRYDRRIDQAVDISPKPLRGSNYRVIRTQPIVFSPVDPHILYFASNTVWKTTNGGRAWTEISPDLTRKDWTVPANVGKYIGTDAAKPSQRGVVYALAPSPLDINRIWAGTDDGLIHVTTDGGKSWSDLTPKELVPWAKVSIMEASHFDAQEAYAAINTLRLDDPRAHILRTRDGGKTWTHITNGIPDAGIINVVREDPKTRGLLFAGSEREVHVSFDDGDHWQTLRLNMPASSIRDLVIKDNDVVVAAHGRGFWILDDIAPIRGAMERRLQPAPAPAESGAPFLFTPSQAWRFRWNKNTDTPLPPDEPMGQNPPDGAVVDYWLPSSAQNVTLEILDGSGKLVRKYSSDDKAEAPHDIGNWPWYWMRPPRVLSAAAGGHRFVWDLHYTPLPERRPTFPIAAIPHDTAPDSTSPWVMPGTYTVKLTVDGRSQTRPLVVKMDPRVKTPPEGLMRQFTLSMQIYEDMKRVGAALLRIESMAESARNAKVGEIAGPEEVEGGPRRRRGGPDTLRSVAGQLRTLLEGLQSADIGPTTQMAAAVADRHRVAEALMQKWEAMQPK